MRSKPKPIPQEYYNENRERFDAETSNVAIEQISRRCKHHLIVEGTNIECTNCNNGWIGLAKYIRIVNGKVVN